MLRGRGQEDIWQYTGSQDDTYVCGCCWSDYELSPDFELDDDEEFDGVNDIPLSPAVERFLYHGDWLGVNSVNHAALRFDDCFVTRSYGYEYFDRAREEAVSKKMGFDWWDFVRRKFESDNNTWRLELDFLDSRNGKLYFVDVNESNGDERKRFLMCEGLSGEYSWFGQINKSEGGKPCPMEMSPFRNLEEDEYQDESSGIRIVKSEIISKKGKEM